MQLADLPLGTVATVLAVAGAGAFRRRLMELGMVPGTRIEVKSTSPLGDPLELLVRGASLSIRRSDAASVQVEPGSLRETAEEYPSQEEARVLVVTGCRGGP